LAEIGLLCPRCLTFRDPIRLSCLWTRDTTTVGWPLTGTPRSLDGLMMTSCWICSVPSKMSWSGTPRLSAEHHSKFGPCSAIQSHLEVGGVLADAYAGLHLRHDGTGTVAADPLELHPLYIAQKATGGPAVIGDRAALVGAVAEQLGIVDALTDPTAAADLAWIGYVAGARSGSSGVRGVPTNSRVRLQDGSAYIETLSRALVDLSAKRLPLDDAVEMVRIGIVTALEHALHTSTSRPPIEITDGKDSRVIAACAAGAGLLGEFDLVTCGGAGNADVIVGVSFAEALGVRHFEITEEHLVASARLEHNVRLRLHVHRTTGLSSLTNASEPAMSDRRTVSGVMGEILRTSNRRHVVSPPSNWNDATDVFVKASRCGIAEIFRPSARIAAEGRTRELFRSAGASFAGPADGRLAWFLCEELPGWRGPISDLHDRRILPFYSAGIISAALAIGANLGRATQFIEALSSGAPPC